jgi:hypothetical protein
MILRSLLITDLLPDSDGPERLRCGCGMPIEAFEFVLGPELLSGSSDFGSAEVLRVNMKLPRELAVLDRSCAMAPSSRGAIMSAAGKSATPWLSDENSGSLMSLAQ